MPAGSGTGLVVAQILGRTHASNKTNANLFSMIQQLYPLDFGLGRNREFGLAGAEARLILLTLSARLKPCPCYKAPWVEFFRSLS